MQYKIWILNVAVHQSEKLNAVVSVPTDKQKCKYIVASEDTDNGVFDNGVFSVFIY